MNYLREIRAFERRMLRAPLSATAQLLWYKLMHFDNGLYWRKEFQIDNKRLMTLLNTMSNHSAINARTELIEDGLLVFSPGVRGKPSIYRLVSVEELEGPDIPEEPDGPANFLYGVKEDITTYFGYTEALGRELQQITDALWAEFLPGKTPSAGDVRQVFEYIRVQTERDDGSWEMTFPEKKKELLAYAFDQARKAGKVYWNYIEGIYSNFGQRGITSVDEARDYEFNRGSWKGR